MLELACGAGGVGLAAAERADEVVLSDVAPAMVEIAAARRASAASRTSRRLRSTSTRSASRTRPTTSCSAARVRDRPGGRGPFSLSDAGELRGALAPFADVAIEEVEVPLRAGSFGEWWARTTALAGPLAQLLVQLPEAEVRVRARDRVHAYLGPDGVDLPGMSLVASGRVRGWPRP